MEMQVSFHWINVSLHDHEDNYYLVKATTGIHNIMVQEHLCCSEQESGNFYEVVNVDTYDDSSDKSIDDHNAIYKCQFVGDFDAYYIQENILKYQLFNTNGRNFTTQNHHFDCNMQRSTISTKNVLA